MADKFESQFQQWFASNANARGWSPNPDDPEHYYDYRELFKNILSGKEPDPSGDGHFPSTYKTEGHPRTYLDDSHGRIFDTRTGRYEDGKPVPGKLMQLSEDSPDTGLKPEDVQRMKYLQALLGKGGFR